MPVNAFNVIIRSKLIVTNIMDHLQNYYVEFLLITGFFLGNTRKISWSVRLPHLNGHKDRTVDSEEKM